MEEKSNREKSNEETMYDIFRRMTLEQHNRNDKTDDIKTVNHKNERQRNYQRQQNNRENQRKQYQKKRYQNKSKKKKLKSKNGNYKKSKLAEKLSAGIFILAFLVMFLTGFVTSCGGIVSTASLAVSDTWMSNIDDIEKTEIEYTKLELELQEKINNIKNENAGYDEYRVQAGSIEHDPIELISYLSARDIIFTYEDIKDSLKELINKQYIISTSETVENIDNKEKKILNISVVKKTINELAIQDLSEDEKKLYDSYMKSKGGIQKFETPLEFDWHRYVSSYYGYAYDSVSEKKFNTGVDVAIPANTKVYSVGKGKITDIFEDTVYGKCIVIEDGDYKILYGNIKTNLYAGKEVDEKTYLGVTDTKNKNQLHIEYMYKDKYYNPIFYLKTGEGLLEGVPTTNTTVTSSNQTGSNNLANLPQDSATQSNQTFQRLKSVGDRYLGMPYTFGGTPPQSFDCSAFVCWVFTQSGVYNLPRTTAQEIYNKCNVVSPENAKAGDIIFFTGTYNAGRPVTHVAIYCGNSVMLHCGDPIQYTTINTAYWRAHFYSFGRLPGVNE